jgi:putative sterol carrier protein
MASVDECRTALREVAYRLSADQEAGAKVSLDRAVACHITDLDVYFHGRLRVGQLVDIADGDDPRAQIRLNVSSDDLQAMVDGDLHFASAWMTGRLSVKASFGDLLKLRKLL